MFGNIAITNNNVFISEEMQEVMEIAKEVVEERGMLVINGDYGSGKTVMLELVKGYLAEKKDVEVVEFIPYQKMTLSAMVRYILRSLGEKPVVGLNEMAMQIKTKLLELASSGVKVVLVIDNIEDLPLKGWRFVKILNELRVRGIPVGLGIIAAGHVSEVPREVALRAEFFRLNGLTDREVEEYIQFKAGKRYEIPGEVIRSIKERTNLPLEIDLALREAIRRARRMRAEWVRRDADGRQAVSR